MTAPYCKSYRAIEEDALDDITVVGVVTFTICDVRSDNSII